MKDRKTIKKKSKVHYLLNVKVEEANETVPFKHISFPYDAMNVPESIESKEVWLCIIEE